MKKAFLLLCVGVGLYQGFAYLRAKRAERVYEAFRASLPSNRPPSRAGFVDEVELQGIDPNVMTVFMPVGCPYAAGQRGRALIAKMDAAGIPETACSRGTAKISARTRAEFDAQYAAINKVMTGDTPIVFYRGRAKSNPSFEDVLLEYQTSR